MQADYEYNDHKLDNFLFDIIELGNIPLPKDPRNNWDTKKEIIKKLLEEACFFHASANNVNKVEEYSGLALCLDDGLNWPYKQMSACYKKHKNRCHTLPAWHQEKLLKNMTLSKMLAEELLQNSEYAACKKVLEHILQKYPKSTWACEMLNVVNSKI